MKDRLFKNPLSSLVGLILIGAGIYVFNVGPDNDSNTLIISTLLIGLGAVGLGLKDKGNVGPDA